MLRSRRVTRGMAIEIYIYIQAKCVILIVVAQTACSRRAYRHVETTQLTVAVLVKVFSVST